MASIRKKPGSTYWFAAFTAPDGRRVQRSTRTTDRRIALKMAMTFEEVSRNRATEAQLRRVLADLGGQILGTRLESPSVEDFAATWLQSKQGETAAVTFAAYKGAVADFIAFLGDKQTEPIHFLTPAQITAWRDAAAKRASPRTANNKLKIVRVMLGKAWKDGILQDNPAEKVDSLRTEESTRRPFTLPELKSVLRAASPDWRGMILFGIFTGQRLKDIASLTWQNVDTAEREIAFVTSKTGRPQRIPIAKPVQEFLDTLPATDDPNAPLFPAAFKIATENRDVSPLSQEFHEILVAANLAKARAEKDEPTGVGRTGKREVSGLSFHSLRHTATSLLKKAGASEAVAMDIIGHDSKAVSSHYTHTDSEQKAKAIRKMSRLINLDDE